MTSIEMIATDYQHAQRVLAVLQDEWRQRQEALRNEHADLLDAIDAAKEEAGLHEARLTSAALAIYNATGNKQPSKGIGIRVRRKTTITDSDAAKAWAFRHQMGLKIDEPRLIKIVDALAYFTPDWLETTEEPHVTISAELRGTVLS